MFDIHSPFIHGTILSILFRNNESMGGVYISTAFILYTLFTTLLDDNHYIKKLLPYWSCGTFYINSLIIEGTISCHNGPWNSRVSAHLSDEFSAIMDYISKNGNSSATTLKQIVIHDEERHSTSDGKTIYICDSQRPMRLDKDIICRIESVDEYNSDENKSRGAASKTKRLSIELLSSTLSVLQIKDMVNKITHKYIENIKRQKKEKVFIYRYRCGNSDDDSPSWHEVEFKSCRRFDNMFFKGKELFLDKIRFFIENEQWYKDNGHPYTLGIGLKGPPGTGKTSLIKALANLLNRHIIEVPINEMKSEEQFFNAYFETKYRRRDKEELYWSDKIMLFEDIDAQSDLVKSRTNKQEGKQIDFSGANIDITKLKINKDDGNDGSFSFMKPEKKEVCPITLSTILNALDGIRENHGRVMVITSNHYDALDPALTRRGRIDIELEMTNADIDIVKQIYEHSYNENINAEHETLLKNINIPTCDVVGHLKYGADKEAFIEALLNR